MLLKCFQHQYGEWRKASPHKADPDKHLGIWVKYNKLENMQYSPLLLWDLLGLQMLLQDLLLPEVQRPPQDTLTLPNEVLYLLLKNVHIHNRWWLDQTCSSYSSATTPRPAITKKIFGPVSRNNSRWLICVVIIFQQVFLFQIDSRLWLLSAIFPITSVPYSPQEYEPMLFLKDIIYIFP